MKIFLYFILLLIALQPAGAQHWNHVNPFPSSAQLSDVVMINQDTAFACGSSQTILKTSDGGITWQKKGLQSELNDLNSIFFIDDDTGFVAGSGGALRTFNGGETWENIVTNSEYSLMDVFFIDKTHGWICGDSALVLGTADGGVSWQTLTKNTVYGTFEHIKFISADTGYVSNWSYFGKTTDGGYTWTEISVPADVHIITTFEVTRNNDLWIGSSTVDNQNFIYHTTNDGLSWTMLLPEKALQIQFADQLNGKILGLDTIFITSDGGLNWQFESIPDEGKYIVAMAWSDSTGITVGFNGEIFKSVDGGNLWNEMSSGLRAVIYDGFFFNDQKGFLVGQDNFPVIYESNDYGHNWTMIYRDTTSLYGSLNSIAFSGPFNGWAAGSNLLHTTDGGQHWTKVTTGLYPNPEFVTLYTDKYIWIGGTAGWIIRSTNFGQTWTDISLPFPVYHRCEITELNFTDSNNGYCSLNFYSPDGSHSGQLLITHDGGLNWETRFSGPAIKDIETINGTCYITMAGSGIMKTSDNGTSWEVLGTIGAVVPDYLRFFNSLQGVAVQNDNFLAVTNDGGLTWGIKLDTIRQAFRVQGYFFNSPDHGLLFGFNGLIEAYENDNIGLGSEKNIDYPVLFPNPSEYDLNIIYHDAIIKAEILNQQGKIVKLIYNKELNVINVSELQRGMYIIKLSTRDKDYFQKFIRN